MIGRSGERESGISMLAARLDIYIYIYIYIQETNSEKDRRRNGK